MKKCDSHDYMHAISGTGRVLGYNDPHFLLPTGAFTVDRYIRVSEYDGGLLIEKQKSTTIHQIAAKAAAEPG